MVRILLLFAFLFSGVANADEISVERVFVPQGFDDNDNVQIVVSATFPSTCWRLTEIKISQEADLIKVRFIGKELDRLQVCLPVEIPFYRTIDLGILESGDYAVQVGDRKIYYHLHVGRSTAEERDEKLYANVTTGYVSGRSLVLKGLHPDSTFYLHEILVQVEGDVIEVLPIAKKSGSIGALVTVPFQTSLDLSPFIKRGETYLVHIRSLNGNSVNIVESF